MAFAKPGGSHEQRLVAAAPDSFKGTCGATEAAQAVAIGARRAGWACDCCPLSDGGEGFAQVLASHTPKGQGRWETTIVTGPLGAEVAARWWWSPSEAVLESAAASGLVLAGGASGNDPLAATSRGTGELIAAALRSGASRLLVGLGGSASTDGGLGALEALDSTGGLGEAEVLVACDVLTSFVDAASQFAPQKGASPAQVTELQERLLALGDRYLERFGVDVTCMPRAGAAGGLAGGLAALGATLVGGLDLVAERAGLDRRIGTAELVITAEGCLDSSSWSGKVVGEVLQRARLANVPAVVLAGTVGQGGLLVPAGSATAGPDRGDEARFNQDPEPERYAQVEVVSLAERFGLARALVEPASCIEEVVRELLEAR
jgi:glycerate kinase